MVEKHNHKDPSVTVRRRSSVTVGNRMNRQESITRGTASSIAKMVRPQDHDQPHTHHHYHKNKNKKKRNSGVPTTNTPKKTTIVKSKQEEQEYPRRKSWCSTTKKRTSRLSPNNSDSHIVNASNDRLQYKRDSIDSLTTSTTASSHEEDYIPKPSRSIKPFPLKAFKEDDVPPLDNTPDCKQKDNADLILEKKHSKYTDDFHDAPIPHYMTVLQSCNHYRKPSSSKNTSSSDDDLPTTPIDQHSPCCSPVPQKLDYDHQIEKIEKSIEKEQEQQVLDMLTSKSTNHPTELKMHVSEPTVTTYSTKNTIIHHTKKLEADLCSDLSQQLIKADDKWARLKWNLGQWFGTIVGTGEIKSKDYDDYGHPRNITISGQYVMEPGLLPKKSRHELVYHSYLIELNRQKRFEDFRMINKNRWVPDTQVSTCNSCTTKFGIFNRRHHCRSCGHIFCQSHSANRLALFHPDDTGEWVRVCDSCIRSLVKPLKKGKHMTL